MIDERERHTGLILKVLGLLTIIAFNLTTSFANEPMVTDTYRAIWPGNGHTYSANYVPEGITWTQANAIAIRDGGYLATITSPRENEFVYENVANHDEFWFDGNPDNGYGPWLGGYQIQNSTEPNGGWAWANGEPMNYANWATGQPDNYNGNEDRLIFYGSSAWNDYPGDLKAKGFIVEYDIFLFPCHR
jgi:hypothetical protein